MGYFKLRFSFDSLRRSQSADPQLCVVLRTIRIWGGLEKTLGSGSSLSSKLRCHLVAVPSIWENFHLKRYSSTFAL